MGLCLLLLVTASTAQRKASLEKRFERLKNLSLIPALGDPARFVDHRDRTSLLSRILIPRVPESAGSKKVLDALKEPFEALNRDAKSLGWHVQTLPFETKTPHGMKKMTNLVITKNPASPRRLTLAAHYDSKVLPRGFLGATDSAAPCAIIVDTAIALDAALDKAERRYAKEGKGKGSDVTLQLIFFDGEEAYGQWTHTDSIYGSKDLASNWTRSAHSPPHAPPVGAARLSQARFATERPIRSIDTIEHLVLLDLLGASHPQIPPYFPSTSWLNTRLSEAQKRLQQELLFWPPHQTANRHDEKWFGGHAWGGIEDDHLPFLANGVPILHLIPTPFPAVWHTMQDDASALDYGTNYGWTMLMRLFVAEYLNLAAADLEQAPRANRQRQEREWEKERWDTEEGERERTVDDAKARIFGSDEITAVRWFKVGRRRNQLAARKQHDLLVLVAGTFAIRIERV
ncbi:Glutaminyl cyclase [Ceraceosorus bombacis]|uniref:Peptide hydrolase n=1 Tax=Ceraceosorus bombacis TaxID=401625 RepID=A0A0P1BKF2_9BASI|nr:Glutaminyl cyclase [Ceraceosorus bombacis]